MASLSVPSARVRPITIVVAVILSVLVILGNLASPLLPSGSGDDKVPTSVIVIGVILALIGIVAAIGLWMLRRWGEIVTIAVSAINLILAVPGIPFGPGMAVKILSALFTLACVAVIVLVLLPESRRAYR